MVTHETFQISTVMIVFMCLGVALIGGLLVMIRLGHSYHPNLICAMLCFLLLEALPALT
ncbi:MAG: hypothetical protein CPDRYMAC_1980 [uncultured Paraburkholderia sp.]|nr:MAG: hypothetical protein CPDRYDRY_2027 [uncultured Paraburkholderia sp.]CAH2921986.1 MAG: hypothetical protein CPDRYMAC_1980 [uncultured Paraburkholderia sp.]